MIIGTAGHVDHGKTALVRALTGVDTDRLAEEKRRGITIELGYAYAGPLGFVDVPGHERLVHTMLAGAGGIDAALLVVALNEGVMPQTVEHLQILDLLGIPRGVVALTKSDLAPDRVAAVTEQVRALLAGTALAGAPMVPVSARTGEGVPELQAALLSLDARPRDQDGYPRLAVDRAFVLSGAGLVVTGTLVSGRVAADDRLLLSPSGLELRVRGLHAGNQPATAAVAGQRVALNIVGPRLEKASVARGDWVLHPSLHAPTDQLDARIGLIGAVPRARRQDLPVHAHLGAAHVMARLLPLDDGGLSRLSLARPIGALALDRIVLRDAGAAHTIGGGAVIDPFPPRRGRRTPARLASLAAREAPDVVVALRRVLALAPGWIEAAPFLRARNVTSVEPVLAAADAVEVGGLALSRATLCRARAAIHGALDAYHRSNPDLPGPQADSLRMLLAERFPPAPFRSLLDRLRRDGAIERDGPWWRLPGHRITLTAQDERRWLTARALIAAERFRPPRTRDLARALSVPEADMRGLLKRLQRMGKLIEVAHDHFFERETVAEMATVASAAVDATGLLTAAAFRDRLDNGRKVAIQILEFFDRCGMTARTGDERRIRSERIGMFDTEAH
jgi:selenocysteine-specific elongation factor